MQLISLLISSSGAGSFTECPQATYKQVVGDVMKTKNSIIFTVITPQPLAGHAAAPTQNNHHEVAPSLRILQHELHLARALPSPLKTLPASKITRIFRVKARANSSLFTLKAFSSQQ